MSTPSPIYANFAKPYQAPPTLSMDYFGDEVENRRRFQQKSECRRKVKIVTAAIGAGAGCCFLSACVIIGIICIIELSTSN